MQLCETTPARADVATWPLIHSWLEARGWLVPMARWALVAIIPNGLLSPDICAPWPTRTSPWRKVQIDSERSARKELSRGWPGQWGRSGERICHPETLDMAGEWHEQEAESYIYREQNQMRLHITSTGHPRSRHGATRPMSRASSKASP